MSVKVDGRNDLRILSIVTLEGRVELQPPSHAWSVSQHRQRCWWFAEGLQSCMFAMRNPPEIGSPNMFMVYLCLSFIYLLGAHRLSKCWWLAQDLLVYPPCLSGSFCWRSGWLNPWNRYGPVGGQRSVKFQWNPLKPNMMIIYDFTYMCIHICILYIYTTYIYIYDYMMLVLSPFWNPLCHRTPDAPKVALLAANHGPEILPRSGPRSVDCWMSYRIWQTWYHDIWKKDEKGTHVMYIYNIMG